MDQTEHEHLWAAAVDDEGRRLPAPGEWHCECGATEPGCSLCGGLLAFREVVTCGRCVHRTSELLAEIERLYREMPDAIKTITGIDYDRTGPASAHDVILPGGDALAILAGGTASTVTADRHGNRSPEDQYESDPPSAAAVVGMVEDEWRRARGDSAAPYAQSVRMGVSYLRDHNAWAASFYEPYPHDVAALRHLRDRMAHTAGRADVPELERTPCVFCGGKVVRFWRDRSATELGGLSEIRKCQGCHMTWGDGKDLAFVNREHLQAMPDTHPEALVTERQAASIFFELADGTIRTWLARDRARRKKYEDALEQWEQAVAQLDDDEPRPAPPVEYVRRLPERGEDVLGQPVYRLADITAWARPERAEERAS